MAEVGVCGKGIQILSFSLRSSHTAPQRQGSFAMLAARSGIPLFRRSLDACMNNEVSYGSPGTLAG